MTDTESQSKRDPDDLSTATALTPESAVAAVREMIEMMSTGGVKELDVRFGDVSIRLRSQGKGGASSRRESTPVEEVPSLPTNGTAAHVVTAPMIGTFYVGSSPHDPPFVEIGDDITTGQIIGIIEAMKIMNEIISDADGRVMEIVATNGEAVEYGSPLIRLAPVETIYE